jgi:hypothetical protein
MNSARRLITWGWILVAMIPAAIVVYAIVSAIANAAGLDAGSPVKIIINVIVFLFCAVGVIGLPVGVVLLIVGYTNRSHAPVNTIIIDGAASQDTPPVSRP